MIDPSSPTAMYLRPVVPSDLPRFFAFQQDPEAIQMAAFTSTDPSDEAAFQAHWAWIQARPDVLIRTIELDGGRVAGSVLRYVDAHGPEVSYWIDRDLWGRGIATAALAAFLADVDPTRPMYARAAADNAASLRVLAKCGFARIAMERGFANARGEEIDEVVLELK